jgi:hypothetical protein
MKRKTIRALDLGLNIRPPRPVDVANQLRRMRTELLLRAEQLAEAIERIEARPDYEQRNA